MEIQSIKELIQKNELIDLKIQLDSLNEITTYSELLLYAIENETTSDILNLLLTYIENENFFEYLNGRSDNKLETIKLVYKKLLFNDTFINDFIKYIKTEKSLINEIPQQQEQELSEFLYTQAITNNFSIIKYLIKYEEKTSLKIVNMKYDIFFKAVEQNSLPIVRYLIQHGININEKNNSNFHESVLLIAFKNNYIGMANLLISNGIKVKDPEINRIISLAIQNDNLKILDCLLHNSINIINKIDSSGNTPLHLAVQLKKSNFINYLLENGADVNIKNKDGLSPLFLAYNNHDQETIHTLILHNANINDTNEDGETLLFLASKDNDIELVKYLINSNADLNTKDRDGTTPLMTASHERYFQVVRWLIRGGAGLNEKNKYHDTALYYSSPDYGYKKEIYNILKVRGAY